MQKSLSTKQAADFLAISEASVRRWTDSGYLPYWLTPGGHRRFDPDELSAWKTARRGLRTITHYKDLEAC